MTLIYREDQLLTKMLGNRTVFLLLVAVWSCSMNVFGVSAPSGPLQNHVTGGFKREFT